MDMQEFVYGYLSCALWSSTGNDGEFLDTTHTLLNLAPEATAQCTKECQDFVTANADLLDKAHYGHPHYSDSELAGHDFWLTRNGHGSGYWDGDIPKEIGEALTKAARACGERHLYVGDDGLIYVG